MARRAFLAPRLTGSRFTGHAIPLEVLSDLSVIDEMVKEVARQLWLKEHPERKRLPRLFLADVRISLAQVQTGSAVPQLVLESSEEEGDETERIVYFSKARDSILDAIDAAMKGDNVLAHISESAVGYFDRLGRHLHADEAIEFPIAGRETVPRLDLGIRRKLILSSNKIKELSHDLVERGRVPEVDKSQMSFHLELADGRKVKGVVPPQHLESLVQAFNGFESGERVMIEGVGVKDRDENLLRFEKVDHVTLLEPLDVPSRLDAIRLLGDGWHEGQGRAPAKEFLDWFEESFVSFFPNDLPLPHVFPSIEGGLSMEWANDEVDASCEVDPGSRAGLWHVWNASTNIEEHEPIPLSGPEGWNKLASNIRRLFGAVE